MKWLKVFTVGLTGSLLMFIIMILGIHVTTFAPFNIPPSAAFLVKLGLYTGPLPLIVHFGYGALWSLLFVYFFDGNANIKNGLLLAIVLWLVMMIVYSPIIGWGIFGFGGAGNLPATDPLFLEPGPRYMILTFVLHIIYGLTIGWLNPAWVGLTPPYESQ